jgi:hypothetical protein
MAMAIADVELTVELGVPAAIRPQLYETKPTDSCPPSKSYHHIHRHFVEI